MTVLAFIVFEIVSASCLPALLMACEIPHNHRRIDAPRRVVIKCRLPIQRLASTQSFLHRTLALKWRSAFLASALKSLSKFNNNCSSKFECDRFIPKEYSYFWIIKNTKSIISTLHKFEPQILVKSHYKHFNLMGTQFYWNFFAKYAFFLSFIIFFIQI